MSKFYWYNDDDLKDFSNAEISYLYSGVDIEITVTGQELMSWDDRRYTSLGEDTFYYELTFGDFEKFFDERFDVRFGSLQLYKLAREYIIDLQELVFNYTDWFIEQLKDDNVFQHYVLKHWGKDD